MSSTLRTFAYYDFPVPISVLAEVLGSAMPTRIGRAEAVIYTPGALSNEQIHPWPKAPFIKDGPGSDAWASFQSTDWAVTYAGDYDIDGQSVPATRLLRIAIELLDPADDLPTHPEEFGRSDTRASLYAHDGIDRWMERVRTWVEVATGQDLDRNHRLYDMTQHGDGLHFWRDGD